MRACLFVVWGTSRPNAEKKDPRNNRFVKFHVCSTKNVLKVLICSIAMASLLHQRFASSLRRCLRDAPNRRFLTPVAANERYADSRGAQNWPEEETSARSARNHLNHSTSLELQNPSSLTRDSDEVDDTASFSFLTRRQIQIEAQQQSTAIKEYTESLAHLMTTGHVTGLKRVQQHIMRWYEPLMREITAEQILLKMKIPRMECSGFLKKWQEEHVSLAKGSQRRIMELTRIMLSMLAEEQWSAERRVKLGSMLLSMLIQTAKARDGSPAFLHSTNQTIDEWTESGSRSFKKIGVLQLCPEVAADVVENDFSLIEPRFLPMLVPPRSWAHNRNGVYQTLRTELMRVYSPSQKYALAKADIPQLLEGLDYIGNVRWRINRSVLDVVKEAYRTGELIGELPRTKNIPMPSGEKPLSLREARDMGRDSLSPEEWKQYFDYSKKRRLVNKTNAELHSLRCDANIKLHIADQFANDVLYFPCNIDFRGRAYPIAPNLNHVGSDLCRGLLRFADSKPIGAQGFRWMKIHLCNLFGNNKISLDEREMWTDAHLDDVIDSAKNPLSGRRWWAAAENPFQALACCFELNAAIESRDPENYQCSLPIHQDGSCNGLQHYAALGRDVDGARAVNLIGGSVDQPGDVYVSVLNIVLDKIEADSRISESETDPKLVNSRKYAKLLIGKVDRKVIKQTVMTSVYGVTALGARDQIYNRLVEKFRPSGSVGSLDVELLEELNRAAG